MKYPNYNAKEVELEIIKFWQKNKVVEKLRERNKNGKKFYFLDGPPYTSGKFHLAHAWNYAIKDLVLRYKRMQGLNVWDRNGFDVHGLPTEHKVMAKHGLKTKEDIEKFGVDKFTKECQDFCLEMAEVMTKDLVRMGVSLNLDDPYLAFKSEFIEGEWALIKKAHEKKLLYYGEKVLTWCQHCETAVAKHECEYQNVKDKSIYVKFKIENGADNEFLVIWTTTPWTIPFNLAIMANPKIDYVKIDVGDEKWVVAKDLVESLTGVAKTKFKIIEKFKGKKLEGIKYLHPFNDIVPKYSELKKDNPNVHTVILNEQYVDTSAGTGLVHCAPGCGPEDQDAAKPYNIPPLNNLSEDGYYPSGMGKFEGLRAKVDDLKFIEYLNDENALVAKQSYKHEYPHCWRCKNPVIFRITFQWFFKIEDLKHKILAGNKKVGWVPDTALHSYEAWVKNLKDNSISRQRYWGTPVPIWKCKKCENITVISSREDIKQHGGKVPKNLHIPWIDKVKLDCKCGARMDRVPDIIDVWVDAGTASWNCLYNDKEKIDQWFPADFIMEAKEQTRLWFSMLSICSYIYMGKNAFKNVYVYGMLNDVDGKKMSKSLGNIISPYELIDKHSVDVLRYYMCQNNAGQDIRFSWDETQVKSRHITIFWNLHKLLINLAKENDVNPFSLDDKKMQKLFSQEEKFIFSKLNSTIKQVTSLMEDYKIDDIISPLEDLLLELSRTYIQIIRDKSVLGSKEEKELCVYTITQVLFEGLKMFQIVLPFVSETIYQNFKDEFGGKNNLKEESISHYSWPKPDLKKISVKLEEQFELVSQIIQSSLAAREKAKLGLRWPIKELVVVSTNELVSSTVKNLAEILKNQINVKKVKVLSSLPGVKETVKINHSQIGPVYGKLTPKINVELNNVDPKKILKNIRGKGSYDFKIGKDKIEIKLEMLNIEQEDPENHVGYEFKNGQVYLNTERDFDLESEGYARELMRKVQSLRKDSGLEKLDKIDLKINCSEEMASSLNNFKKDIADKVGAEKVSISSSFSAKVNQFSSEFKIKNETFIAYFDKV